MTNERPLLLLSPTPASPPPSSHVVSQPRQPARLRPRVQPPSLQSPLAPAGHSQSHQFALHDFEYLVACQLCYQLIFGKAIVCRDCHLTCHAKCEIKASGTCEGPISEKSQSRRRAQLPEESGGGGGAYQRSADTTSSSRSTAYYSARMTRESATADFDVIYITERLLIIAFPSHGSEADYRRSLKDVSQMLSDKHDELYKVFNVSRRRRDVGALNRHVVEMGWPEELAPPLDRLCAVCKELEAWLGADARHVAVVHSRAGRNGPAIVVAAYLHYTNIYSRDDHSLDRFAMRRFSEDYVSSIAQPSHRRYVNYFTSLLSGVTKINSRVIYLQQIAITNVPTLEDTGASFFLKVYEKMVPVFESGALRVEAARRVTVRLDEQLALRGDVLVKCAASRPNGARRPLFRCQLNTCALTAQDGLLRFAKKELDDACFDRNWPDDSVLELRFSYAAAPPQNDGNKFPASDTFDRTDSYENFDEPADDSAVDCVENGFGSDFDSLDAPSTEAASTRHRRSELTNESGISADLSAPSRDAEPVVEQPVQKVQRQRATLDAVKDQLERVFGAAEAREIDAPPPPPPPPPPKPQRIEFAHVPPSLLPAGVRRPSSPPNDASPPHANDPHSTPLIDVDRIGPDRYDPQSKAFSYVPARALRDHFKAPKRQTRLVQRIEDSEGREVLPLPQHEPAAQPNYPSPPSVPSPPPAAATDVDSADDALVEQVPKVVNQRSKVRKTKYNNYRTLDDYSSDMDDLCDPDFYLSYTSTSNATVPTTTTTQTSPTRPQGGGGTAAPSRPSTSAYPDAAPSPASRLNSTAEAADAQRMALDDVSPIGADDALARTLDFNERFPAAPTYPRASNSVTTTPVQTPRLGAARRRNHSFSGNADDWLEEQLEKLRSRKESLDPERQRRKDREKQLLDELKHIHEDRMIERQKDESDYTVEGMGTKSVDAFTYLDAEERPGVLTRPSSGGNPRSLGPAAPPHDPFVRGKPPTPPPRERSRTPPSSPTRRLSPVTVRRGNTPPPAHLHVAMPPPYGQVVAVDKRDFADGRAAPTADEDSVAISLSDMSPKSILKKPKLTSSSNSSVTNGPAAAYPQTNGSSAATAESSARQQYSRRQPMDAAPVTVAGRPIVAVRAVEAAAATSGALRRTRTAPKRLRSR